MAIGINRDTKQVLYGKAPNKIPAGNWLIVTDGSLPFCSDVRGLIDLGVPSKYWKVDESVPSDPRVTEMTPAEKTVVNDASVPGMKAEVVRRLRADCNAYLERQGFDNYTLQRWMILLSRFRANSQAAKVAYCVPIETWVSQVTQHLGVVEASIRSSGSMGALQAAYASRDFAQFTATKPNVDLSSIP